MARKEKWACTTVKKKCLNGFWRRFHGRELCFCSFILSPVIFLLGGCISLYEGIMRLRSPVNDGSPAWSHLVIEVAFVFTAISAWASFKAFKEKPIQLSFLRAVQNDCLSISRIPFQTNAIEWLLLKKDIKLMIPTWSYQQKFSSIIKLPPHALLNLAILFTVSFFCTGCVKIKLSLPMIVRPPQASVPYFSNKYKGLIVSKKSNPSPDI